LPITTDYSVKCFAKHEYRYGFSVGTSLNEAIKLSSTYYDDKTSKLLIMISDGKIIARAQGKQKKE
jgi:Ca-activated chloride channel family protein